MASPGGVLGPQAMWLVLGVVAVVLLGLRAFIPPGPETNEPIAQLTVGDGDKARVVQITRQDCLSRPGTVWAVMRDGVECIAYSSAGQSGNGSAVMYFSGDVPQHRLGETNQIRLREAYAARAKQLATRHGLMFVMVGRPGLMGSSGFHLLGGRRDEAHVIAAAIDALKSKLSINRLALAGQSGGARIIAQLMVMGRRDIACAAMASGAYGLPRLKGGGTTRTNLFGKPAQRYLVPLRNTDRIVPDSTRRSFVIGDPKDAVTPFGEQREWANMLTASRHHAVLIEAKGAGPEHHGLSAGALEAAALCAKGRPDSEIIDAVRRAG